MKLNITPLRQSEPNECPIICLRMVLNYYGYIVTSADIYKSIIRHNDGSSFNTEIARFAKNLGLNVTCFAYTSI